MVQKAFIVDYLILKLIPAKPEHLPSNTQVESPFTIEFKVVAFTVYVCSERSILK